MHSNDVGKKWLGVGILLIVGLCVVGFLSDRNGPIRAAIKRSEADAIRSEMEGRFDQGNNAAGTWLALQYPDEFPHLLQGLANAGEPNAMLIVGLRTLDRADNASAREHAKSLINAAAAAGDLDATLYLAKSGAVEGN